MGPSGEDCLSGEVFCVWKAYFTAISFCYLIETFGRGYSRGYFFCIQDAQRSFGGMERSSERYGSVASSMGKAALAEEMKYMRQDSPDHMRKEEEDEAIPMFESFKVGVFHIS